MGEKRSKLCQNQCVSELALLLLVFPKNRLDFLLPLVYLAAELFMHNVKLNVFWIDFKAQGERNLWQDTGRSANGLLME